MKSKKTRLVDKADALWRERAYEKWGTYCNSCGAQAGQVHHYYGKGAYAHLRYELNNAVPICNGCHVRHHFASDPNVHHRVDKRRGVKWKEKLASLSLDRPEGTYKTIEYYENIIKQLE